MEKSLESMIKAEKKPGTSGIQGQFYEIELALHFFLKGLAAKREGKIDQFYLASNLKCVHGFDDVIFKYTKKHGDEKVEKIILLQAKHREKEDETITLEKILANISNKGDFSIKQYYDGFNATKLSFLTTQDLILQGDIANCEFVLFSNANLDEGKLGDLIENIDNSEYFGWEDQKRYKFKCTKKLIDLLKRPLHFEKLLQEMLEWMKYKKISKKKVIFQQYSNFIQENIIEIDGREASFKDFFLNPTKNDIEKSFIEDTTILRNEFLNLNKKPVEDIQKVKFAIADDKIKADNQQEKTRVDDLREKLKIDNQETNKFVSEWSETEIKTFLDRFTIMFHQPNVEKLKSLNKEILQSHFILSQDEAELYHVQLKEKICQWWLKVEFYLTGEDKLISELKSDLLFIGKCYEISNKFKKLDLKFQNVEVLINNLLKNNFLCVLTDDFTKIQTEAKVYQTLNSLNELHPYLFLDANSFFEQQNIIIEKFKCKYKILVISDITVQNSKNLQEELFKIVDEINDKKLLFIGNTVELPCSFKVWKEIEVNLTNLTTDSREKFLNQTIIRFHGHSVSLQEIVVSNTIIDHEMFDYLIKNENITIDVKNSDFNHIKSYNIRRKLARCEFIDKRCFHDDHLALVFNEPYIQDEKDNQPPRNIILEIKTKIENEKNSIHYVKQEKNKLVWLKSIKNLKDIREYVTEEISSTKTPEELIEQESQFVIITGEPGIGKSSLISYIMSNTHTKYWMYRINLANHSHLWDNDNFLDPLKFLELACFNFETSHQRLQNLEFKLFKDNIEHRGNLILFFDGFDEICPNYAEPALRMFEKLRQTKIKKILITTRLNTKEDLENRLNTFSYELQPFNPVDQEIFLKLFKNMNDETIKTMLGKFNKVINDQMRKFVSIPLQLRMLAEIYEENAFEELNLYKIYRHFFEKKIRDILYEDKIGTDTNRLASKKVISKAMENFNKMYETLAVLSLFEKQLYLILTPKKIEKMKKKISSEKDDSGIVNYDQNEKLSFVHKTFAEYFVTSFLIRIFKKSVSVDKFINSINMFENSQSVLKMFIDYGLCENQKLCTAVLNKDVAKFEELLLSKHDVFEIDQGGRTPLHLAAAHGHEDLTELLVKYGANVQMKDSVMDWTPISYGDACQHWRISERLLKHGANPNCMLTVIKRLELNPVDMFYIAVKYEYVEILKFCMSKVSFTSFTNYDVQSLLHLAIRRQRMQSVKLLIENGADASSVDENGDTSIHFAVQFGNFQMLKYLMENSNSLNIKNSNGQTILHRAAVRGKIDMIKHLVEKGADPVTADNNGDTSLHLTSEFGHLTALKYLMDVASNSYLIKNNCGQTILHRAANQGKIYVIKYLVEMGADPLIKDNNGDTSLHLTTNFGHLAALKYLMDVTPNSLIIKNNCGQTILHRAAINGNVDMMKFLIDSGADPMMIDNNGNTPLHLTPQSEHLAALKYLIEITPNSFFIKNNYGQTILHCAVTHGKADMIKYLIMIGVDSMSVDNNGDTSLHLASQVGHLDTLKYLMDITPNLFYFKNKDGQTLFHEAVVSGKTDVLRYLIEKGADHTVADKNGNTPLHIAAEFGHFEVLKCLVNITKSPFIMKNNRGETIFHFAVIKGNIDVIKYLIDNGADPMEEDGFGNTSLHLAACYGHLALLKHLILITSCSIDLATKDRRTLLHFAAYSGKIDLIQYLIERGANPLAVDKDGDSPIQYAAESGHILVLEYLLSLTSISIFVKNEEGKTLLHHAAMFGRINMIKYLLHKGLDPLATDNIGNTLLHIAAGFGDIVVFEYLLTITSYSINITNKKGQTPLDFAIEKQKPKMIEYLSNRRNLQTSCSLF